MNEDDLILVESMVSRLDELIGEMEQDSTDMLYQAQEYAQVLRQELVNILESSQ